MGILSEELFPMSFQAYLDNIQAKTGKTPEDFLALAKEKGLLEPDVKTMQIVNWLKTDFGLGHGHAMALVNVFNQATQPAVTNDERIAALFTGSREVWRTPYDELLERLGQSGLDVRVAATDTYISLLKSNKKLGIIQVTGERMDIGIKRKGVAPTSRFMQAGSWNTMVTHRVQITEPSQIDDELVTWLQQAYEAIT
jgi:hypothetical protein